MSREGEGCDVPEGQRFGHDEQIRRRAESRGRSQRGDPQEWMEVNVFKSILFLIFLTNWVVINLFFKSIL